jgi:hypothetical protein
MQSSRNGHYKNNVSSAGIFDQRFGVLITGYGTLNRSATLQCELWNGKERYPRKVCTYRDQGLTLEDRNEVLKRYGEHDAGLSV